MRKKIVITIIFAIFLVCVSVIAINFVNIKNISNLPETGEGLLLELKSNKKDIEIWDEDDRNVIFEVKVTNQFQCNDKPIHAVFLFDVSGSMKESLDQAKSDAINLMEYFDFKRDRVSLFKFNENVIVSTSLSKQGLKKEITDIESGGLTNISNAIDEAIQMFKYLNWSGDKVLVIFSDGRSFLPKEKANELAIEKGREAQMLGINIVAITYGEHADLNLVSSLTSTIFTGGFVKGGTDMSKVYSLINSSRASLEDVNINVDLNLIDNLATLENFSSGGIVNEGNLQWHINSLGCYESVRYRFEIKVRNDINDLERIRLRAVALGEGKTYAESNVNEVIVHAPIFEIDDEVEPQIADVQDMVNIRILVKNVGTGEAKNVKIKTIFNDQFIKVFNNTVEGFYEDGEISWSRVGINFDGESQEKFGRAKLFSFAININENISQEVCSIPLITRVEAHKTIEKVNHIFIKGRCEDQFNLNANSSKVGQSNIPFLILSPKLNYKVYDETHVYVILNDIQEVKLNKAKLNIILPRNFKYIPYSVKLNEKDISEPQVEDNLSWDLSDLKADRIILSFKVKPQDTGDFFIKGELILDEVSQVSSFVVNIK